ncbi:MAG: cardiolipin synthase [Oscillospiraceae bacterium]|nr:cardiolipin synthase [Oscillospiraceae bacterium]
MRMRDELNADKLAKASPGWSRVMNSLKVCGFQVYRNTRIVYFNEGKALLEDILDRCRRAERFIFLEFYLFAEGKLGDRLTEILCEKANEGVEVKIVFDSYGSLTRLGGETVVRLREAGAEVFEFGPVHKFVSKLRLSCRDHRRIACIDDYAFTGGTDVADECANITTRFGYRKDSGIRLEGEGSWAFTKSFLETMSILGGLARHEMDYYHPHGDIRTEGWCQPYTDALHDGRDDQAENTFLQLITNAKRFLYITTPHFVPDESIVRALCIAGDGGVDIRLMLPGMPDSNFSDQVAESYFGELIQHGVKVYRYTPGFLNQKCVMVDREIATVGSVNIDYRSFELDRECGAVVYGCPMIEELLEDMDDLVEKSHQVTLDEWSERKLSRKVIEPLLRLLAIWL